MYKSISDELSWWCPGLCAVWDLPPKAGRGWMDIVWIVTIIVNHVSLWSVLLFSWDLIHYIHTGFADHIIDIRCYWVARHSFIRVMITATSVRQSGVIWKLVLYHPTCLLSENIPSNHQEIHQLMIEQVPKFQKWHASVQDVQASQRAWKRECSLIWVGQLTMADHQFHTVQNYSNSALMMLYQPAQDFPLFEGSMCSTQNINKTFNSQHESTKSINPLPGCILYFDANWLYEPLQGQRIVLCNHICGDHLDLRPRRNLQSDVWGHDYRTATITWSWRACWGIRGKIATVQLSSNHLTSQEWAMVNMTAQSISKNNLLFITCVLPWELWVAPTYSHVLPGDTFGWPSLRCAQTLCFALTIDWYSAVWHSSLPTGMWQSVHLCICCNMYGFERGESYVLHIKLYSLGEETSTKIQKTTTIHNSLCGLQTDSRFCKKCCNMLEGSLTKLLNVSKLQKVEINFHQHFLHPCLRHGLGTLFCVVFCNFCGFCQVSGAQAAY